MGLPHILSWMTSPASVTRRRFRARWWLPLIAVLAMGVLLEGVMQVVSYALWAGQRQPVAPATGQVVLCVGDSWTHGMGSEDPVTGSYPARLQTRLREHGLAEWSVVNCGSSGQNSRDVLERLPSQLADYHPRLVCVLVGQNDYWSRPERLAADATATFDHSAYRFRWRLPRLWSWLVGNLTGASESMPLTRDPAQWSPRQVPVPPDPYAQEPSTWLWTPEIGKRKDEGFAKHGARDEAGAMRVFEGLLADVPGDPQVHQMLAILHRELGRTDDAARELDWLRQAFREREGYWTGIALTGALHELGHWQECIEVARPLLARFPQAAQVWNQLAVAEWQMGRGDEAAAAVDRAIALRFNRWFYFNRAKIHLVGRNDVDAAIRAQFDLYVIENDADFLAQNLREFANGNHQQRVVDLARLHDCDPTIRGRLITIAEAFAREGDQSAPAATLTAHLERMFVAVRNAGAEPVVLCYPWRNASIEVLRAAAEEHDVPFCDVESEFAVRTASRPRRSLQAPDGHCNDAGYAIMTDIIAERVVPLLRATGR